MYQVTFTTEEVQFCDVQLSDAGDAIVLPDDLQPASNDVSQQLAATLSAEDTPLSELHYHDSEDEDEELHPLPAVPDYTTRSGRQVKLPAKFRDFV